MRAKLLNKPSLGLQTRKEFEAFMLSMVDRYCAALFLGKGNYQRIEGKTKEGVIREVMEQGEKKRPWMLYAICPYGGVEHSIHLENIEVRDF